MIASMKLATLGNSMYIEGLFIYIHSLRFTNTNIYGHTKMRPQLKAQQLFIRE